MENSSVLGFLNNGGITLSDTINSPSNKMVLESFNKSPKGMVFDSLEKIIEHINSISASDFDKQRPQIVRSLQNILSWQPMLKNSCEDID